MPEIIDVQTNDVPGANGVDFAKSIRREMKRRTAVEPVIGHVKAKHCMNRNNLRGHQGDRTNAVVAAAGYNFSPLSPSSLPIAELDWWRRSDQERLVLCHYRAGTRTKTIPVLASASTACKSPLAESNTAAGSATLSRLLAVLPFAT